MNDIVNAFTVDVEDYFQVSAFDACIRRDQWDGFESRVVASTRRIMNLLNRYDVKATFFVLGWVASRFPQLVKELHRDGHEIGSHSYWHRQCTIKLRTSFAKTYACLATCCKMS